MVKSEGITPSPPATHTHPGPRGRGSVPSSSGSSVRVTPPGPTCSLALAPAAVQALGALLPGKLEATSFHYEITSSPASQR